MRDIQNASYVNDQRKEYSMYVLHHRAIPALTDGLKPSSRRILWIARDGKHYKTATLAGATMPIHPHAAPESAINTLAAPYKNNLPLLTGEGAFGTLINPTAYGAARYTSVSVSQFTKDVVFRDIDLIPMEDNYDGTVKEPKHFLPLIPVAFLNHQEGIAIGFASTLLPRALDELITLQIAILEGKKRIKCPLPYFAPTDNKATELNKNNYEFRGHIVTEAKNALKIIKLPFGVTHQNVINNLILLVDKGQIVDFEDNSKDVIDITIKIRPSELSMIESVDELLKTFKLLNNERENPVVLDISMKQVKQVDILKSIKRFTEWRLTWYKKRYEKLKVKSDKDIQRLKDIVMAIDKDVGSTARTIKNKTALREFLKTLGIHNIDYIVEMPIYKFTEDEKRKAISKLNAENILNDKYTQLIESEQKRRSLYAKELREIAKNFATGNYTAE